MPPITEENIQEVNIVYTQYLTEYVDEGMDYEVAKGKAQERALSEYEGGFEELMSEGYGLEEAIKQMCKDTSDTSGVLPFYLGEYKYSDEINLRKTIPVEDLDCLLVSKHKDGWDNISLEERNSILFQLGMSVHKAGWWEQEGCYRGSDGKVKEGRYILSEERTDKAWINQIIEGKSVASFEAQVIGKGDRSIYNDLTQLGGPKLY